MYEKPLLKPTPSGFHIHIAQQHAEHLLNDLRNAGFEAELLEGTLGYEDLNNNGGHEEVALIQLPSSQDELKLGRFLRHWNH